MKLFPWKAALVVALCCFFTDKLFAQQLKLGAQPTILDKDAVLELNSDKQGLLLPRVPKIRITAGGSLFGAKPGMLVYVVDESSLYLKKITGWEKVADFTNFTAGTGINIDAATGKISNTGVTSFNSRMGAVSPEEGDYSLDLLSDVAINTGTLADNQVLSFDLTSGKWINKTILTSIATTAPLTGTGTAASPLAIAPGTITDQVLKWDGNNWIAAAPAATVTASPLTGAGTAASPLSIASGTAANQYLKWDGYNWIAAAIAAPATSLPLTGDGTAASPLALTAGTNTNDVLKWNGSNWVAGSETTGSRKLSVNPGVGVKQVTPAIQQDLTADRSWTIDIDNETALWNANKLQGINIKTATPASGQILKYNSTTFQYEPANDSTGGVIFEKMTTKDASYADQPVPEMKMKIWEGPGNGVVTNGPLGLNAWAWSILSFRNGGYTTQLYMDKSTLALKEWNGNTAPLAPVTGNPWYKVVTTHGDNAFVSGGLIFGFKTSDATTEVAQDANNFFYDLPNKRLGIGTNAPQRTLQVTGNMRLTSSYGVADSIMGRTIGGDVNNIKLDAATLALAAGTLAAKNTDAVWNANKLSGYNVSANAPATNNVLVFNGSQWEPKASSATGLTSVTLTMPSIFSVSGSPLTANGTLGVTLAQQGAAKFFAGPAAGGDAAPAFRSIAASDLPSLATLYIQNGTTAQTGSFNVNGTGRVGGNFTLANTTQGSVFFAGNGGVVTENNTKFFWNNSNNRLGIGTNSPNNTLEVAAPTTASPTTNTSGLRLTNLAGKTGDAANSTVLSVNSAGDVILTKNAAQNNWLITGNTGIDPNNSFLGTNDDVKMVIKSNNQSMLEFGRRQTLDLMDTNQNPDGLYSDPNQKVTLLRSALQFESSSEFYKPMFFVNASGNFRMKGSAAANDFFEFGAFGTNNNGGFDFIVGDDGDEPIIFKSYLYSPASYTEMMRLQRGKVGIGLTDEPERMLHVNAKNAPIRLQNLSSTTTSGNLLTIDGNGDVKQITMNNLIHGSTYSTTASNNNNPINIPANVTMVKIRNTNNITISGISIDGGAPADGQIITFYSNETDGQISITNNNNPNSAYRILTLGNLGSSFFGSNCVISNPGSATFTYSGEDHAWILTAVIP